MDNEQKKIVSLVERREQIAHARNWEAVTEREIRLELIRDLADGDLETFLDGFVYSARSTCNYIEWEKKTASSSSMAMSKLDGMNSIK